MGSSFTRRIDGPNIQSPSLAIALIATSSAACASLKFLPKPVTVNDYVSAEASERTKRLLAYQVTNDDPVGTRPAASVSRRMRRSRRRYGQRRRSSRAFFRARAAIDAEDAERIRNAFGYIDNQFVPDQGWGYYDGWQTGVTEVAGWVALAQIAALDHTKPAIWSDEQMPAMRDNAERTLQLLVGKQNAAEGGWGPNIGDASADFLRTYSTAIATWSLIEARRSPSLRAAVGSRYDDAIRKGLGWLLANYNPALGWVPNPTARCRRRRLLASKRRCCSS